MSSLNVALRTITVMQYSTYWARSLSGDKVVPSLLSCQHAQTMDLLTKNYLTTNVKIMPTIL